MQEVTHQRSDQNKNQDQIVEDFINPCTEKMKEGMIESKVWWFSKFLMTDPILRQIDDIAADVWRQIHFEIKQSTLQASLQLVKSTIIALEI